MVNDKVIVTTSWDDGHRLDVRLAALLTKYGLTGTFYVAPGNHELSQSDRLDLPELRRLNAAGFEVGAHTFTHPHLSRLDHALAAAEITASKTWLESAIGRPVTSFCYPYGDYAPITVATVQEAGFTYARTIKRFNAARGSQFEAGTSVHADRHVTDLPRLLQLSKFHPRRALELWDDWSELAIELFDVTPDGGIYHLWGRSWEIDSHGDWDRLERVLAHIATSKRAYAVTNGELV